MVIIKEDVLQLDSITYIYVLSSRIKSYEKLNY